MEGTCAMETITFEGDFSAITDIDLFEREATASIGTYLYNKIF